MLRLSSLSGKVFAAFLVVLATFGGVSAFGALTMRRLGDEVLRVAVDYLTLQVQLHDLKTRQSNLLQIVERADDESQRRTAVVKNPIDAGRRYRKSLVHDIRTHAAQLLADAYSVEEAGFLRMLDGRLGAVEKGFVDDEELFDRVFGPLGSKPLALPTPDLHIDATARDRLKRREAQLAIDLDDLLKALRSRGQQEKQQLARDESRSVWATLLLSLLAAAVGLFAMWLVSRAVSPLGRLAVSARKLARGDYKHRVEVAGDDEIGALAGEFNAMAAALEEREQRLIRSERLAAVGKIAAQITHEIRNPLSSIGLNAELLEDEAQTLDGGADLSKLARAIVKEVDRLAEITEQYLRFARLPQPRLEREDMNAIVASLLAFLRGELAQKDIALEESLAPGLPAVAVDENQIRQALLNLLRNATEAMRGGGRLTVSTFIAEGSGDTVCIRIGDTGSGIRSENLGKIFDPFFTTKSGGTGLGLALTQQIIVEHGGAIDVVSEPDRGTTFTVRLPAAPPPLPSKPPPG